MRTISLLATLVALALTAPPAAALTVRYEHEDLPDAGGGDRWRTEFRIEDAGFGVGEGFSILFDPSLFEALADPDSAGPDWDLIAIQPDPLLPAFGALDGLALTSDPDLGGPFRLEYSWLGAGQPGSQPFVRYGTSFQTLETGETLPVPEPGTGILMLQGLALWVARGARKRRGGELR